MVNNDFQFHQQASGWRL